MGSALLSEMELVRELTGIRLTIDKQLSALGECPSSGEASQINVAIQEDLRTYEKLLQELEEAAEVTDRETDRQKLQHKHRELVQELTELRKSLRQANEQCQEQIAKGNDAQRRELLEGDGAVLQRRRAQTHRSAVEGFGAATDGMRQAQMMLNQELDQSSETLMQMAKSSSVLKTTAKEHGVLSNQADRGKRLLTLFQRRAFTDKVLMYFGLLVFCASCSYVLYKRVPFLHSTVKRVSGAAGLVDLELEGMAL